MAYSLSPKNLLDAGVNIHQLPFPNKPMRQTHVNLDIREFSALQDEIVRCRQCPRLVDWRERVAIEKTRRFRAEEYWGLPIPAFGDSGARLVVVGLAPAAHGGNRTGRMFTGDRSGDWLFQALHRFGFASASASVDRNDGLKLLDCIIVAAVRCAPPENKPLPVEMRNCRRYLREELRLLRRKRVVVTLGHIAFRAFLKAWEELGERAPEPKPVFSHAAEWPLNGGVTLLASYHPSQQNTQTGKLTRKMFHRVFRQARNILQTATNRSGHK
jgi:uracil-DNA glycosylase family 4